MAMKEAIIEAAKPNGGIASEQELANFLRKVIPGRVDTIANKLSQYQVEVTQSDIVPLKNFISSQDDEVTLIKPQQESALAPAASKLPTYISIALSLLLLVLAVLWFLEPPPVAVQTQRINRTDHTPAAPKTPTKTEVPVTTEQPQKTATQKDTVPPTKSRAETKSNKTTSKTQNTKATKTASPQKTKLETKTATQTQSETETATKTETETETKTKEKPREQTSCMLFWAGAGDFNKLYKIQISGREVRFIRSPFPCPVGKNTIVLTNRSTQKQTSFEMEFKKEASTNRINLVAQLKKISQ